MFKLNYHYHHQHRKTARPLRSGTAQQQEAFCSESSHPRFRVGRKRITYSGALVCLHRSSEIVRRPGGWLRVQTGSAKVSRSVSVELINDDAAFANPGGPMWVPDKGAKEFECLGISGS